jgi:hypothetical protein
MKAAIVRTAEHPPVFGEYPDPVEVQGEVIVRVAASALSHLTRSRAAGRHYVCRMGGGCILSFPQRPSARWAS